MSKERCYRRTARAGIAPVRSSRSGRRGNVGGGGEDRQYVERELHLDIN